MNIILTLFFQVQKYCRKYLEKWFKIMLKILAMLVYCYSIAILMKCSYFSTIKFI